MKKTLIASAVAAATFSSFTFAEGTMPTFYGSLELVHHSVDADDPTVANTHEFKDTGSTFGLKHSHELDSGTSVFMKAEFEYLGDESHEVQSAEDLNGDGVVNASDKAKNNGFSLDEAYIGFKGSFGSIQFGSDDTVYEWVDVVDQNEHVGLAGEKAALKEGDNFQYVLGAAEGLELGVTLPVDSDSAFGGALAAKYSVDMITAVFAYSMGREDGNGNAGDTFGLGASINLDALTINAQFESRDEYKNTADDETYFALQGLYTMGANVFRLGYQMSAFDARDEAGIELAAIHNLSDNAFIYVETLFSTIDNDSTLVRDTDPMEIALGATYKF
jgi:hypothetical protein